MSTQTLVKQAFPLEGRNYSVGQVVTFADDALALWARSRFYVSTSATEVAAAIAAGATQLLHNVQAYDSVQSAGSARALGGVCLMNGDSLEEIGFAGLNVAFEPMQSPSGQNGFFLACSMAGGIFSRFVDGGTSGKTTREIIDGGATWSSMQSNLERFDPDYVFNGPLSVNNFATISAAQTIVDAEYMWKLQLARSKVRKIGICTVHAPASANLKLVAAAGNRAWFAQVNAAVIAFAKAHPRQVDLFLFAETIDAADKSGPKAGMSIDGTHNNYAGSPVMANNCFYPVLKDQPVLSAWDTLTSPFDEGNLIGPFASLTGDVAIGTADSGTGTLAASPGASGNLPYGVGARQQVGDATGTIACSSIPATAGRGERSARAVITSGAAGGGGWLRVGDTQTAPYTNFDAARAVRTYAPNERYAISADLMATVLTTGLAAGVAPDVSQLKPGDVFADGAAVFMVQRRPQLTSKVMVSVDFTWVSQVGQIMPWVALNLVDTTGAVVANVYLMYSGAIPVTPWPASGQVGRYNFRQTFDLSKWTSMVGGVRQIGLRIGAAGAIGATATMDLHASDVRIVP